MKYHAINLAKHKPVFVSFSKNSTLEKLMHECFSKYQQKPRPAYYRRQSRRQDCLLECLCYYLYKLEKRQIVGSYELQKKNRNKAIVIIARNVPS